MRASWVLMCLGWTVGCAVYDGTLVTHGKPDGGMGGSSTGVGGSTLAGSSSGGTSTGASGSGSPGDGGSVMSGGQGGVGSGGDGMSGSSGAGIGGADGGTLDAVPPGTELLIDSMEHSGDGVSGPGFSGRWYLFSDQTDGGVLTPSPFMMTALDVPNAGVPASTQAAHAVGTGFTGFGCGMGFGISATTGGKFDVSGYTGITFWARVGSGAQTHITVSTFDTRASAGCVKCGDQPITGFDASTSWQKIRLPFAVFRQGGWGDPQFGFYDPKGGFGGAQFYVGGGSKLDVWIDDVAFYAQ